MDAKKCDRCGAFYEEDKKNSNIEYMNLFKADGSEYAYDLCDDCAKELEKFMNHKGDRQSDSEWKEY